MNERAGGSIELGQLRSGHDDADLERQAPSASRSASSTSTPTSTAFLDGLRGLAALLVFVHHTISFFDNGEHDHGFGEGGEHWLLASLPFVRILFNGGNAAVAVFFVLSGYVLSRSPLRLVRDGHATACLWNLASAVVRRPIRLYGPALAVTLGVALLMHAPFHVVPDMPWPKRDADVFHELMRWARDAVHFFNPFQAHSNEAWFTYSIVVWTLPVELKGSMLVYVLAALHALGGRALSAPRSAVAWSVAAVALLQLRFWSMACFIAGMVLACLDVHALDASFLPRWCRRSPRTQAFLHHAAFVVGYYLLCQPAHGGSPEYSLNTPGWNTLTRLTPAGYTKNQYYRYWTSWGAVLVVYASLRLRWLQHFFRTRPLRYLGKVSFMFYLVHLPMQYVVGFRLERMLGHVPFGADTEGMESWWDNKLRVPDVGPPGFNIQFLLVLAVVLSLNLVIADFLTKGLDMPCVRLAKRLTRRLGSEARVTSSKADVGR